MNEQELRSLIRERIRAGLLPSGRGDRTFGGPGSEAECDCCGEPIARHQIEFEVEFASSHSACARTLVAHRECHRIWWDELETDRLAQASRYAWLDGHSPS
jgi:hypothetical protein